MNIQFTGILPFKRKRASSTYSDQGSKTIDLFFQEQFSKSTKSPHVGHGNRITLGGTTLTRINPYFYRNENAGRGGVEVSVEDNTVRVRANSGTTYETKEPELVEKFKNKCEELDRLLNKQNHNEAQGHLV